MRRKYGYIPDRRQKGDFAYSLLGEVGPVPPKWDLTAGMPKVYDQGQLGSCTANAIGGAFQYVIGKEKIIDFMPSRLFIYYGEREIEGTIDSDAGAMIRDGMKVVSKFGVPPEDVWPYDIDQFTDRPSKEVYDAARMHVVSSYHRIQRNLQQMKSCIASGFPFVGGFTVYSDFESQQVEETGIVNMPQLPREECLGGHAVLYVGYDDADQRFIARNSWGSEWGQSGYFTIPYAYLMDPELASDFWTIRIVTEAQKQSFKEQTLELIKAA